jgi:hypothetical protein
VLNHYTWKNGQHFPFPQYNPGTRWPSLIRPTSHGRSDANSSVDIWRSFGYWVGADEAQCIKCMRGHEYLLCRQRLDWEFKMDALRAFALSASLAISFTGLATAKLIKTTTPLLGWNSYNTYGCSPSEQESFLPIVTNLQPLGLTCDRLYMTTHTPS